MKKRAVDVGFGNTKAHSEIRRIEFPSVCGDFRPARYNTGLENTDPLKRLVADYAGRKFFLGDIAFRQSTARATMSANRFTSMEGMVLMFAALAVLAEEQREEINLVTGLPVSNFEMYKDEYKNVLLGTHHIKLLTPEGGIDFSYLVKVNQVKIIPQPMGTVFFTVLDDKGEMANRLLARGKLGVLDIGKNTVDLVRTDVMDFVDRESTSFSDIGLFTCHQEMSLEINREFGVEIAPEEIEPYIRNGCIKIKGYERSLAGIKGRVFQSVSERIASRVLNVWRDYWELDRIILTGGGSIVLGEHLVRALGDGMRQQVELSPVGVHSNCAGYMKFARRTWK